MTAARLGAYLSLATWEGVLGFAWWLNFLDGHLGYVAINTGLLVAVAVTLLVMRRTDRASGTVGR